MLEMRGLMNVRTYHSGGWVDDLHLLENCGAIVSDQHFTLWCLDLRSKIER